jgi:TetR/AcrR family transcriptional regulator, transcriptional repressor for nem operon
MAADTADRILDTAHSLMVDRGYAAFSYADIADQINVSKATIHHHFPSKEDLAVAVLRRHRFRLVENLAALDGAVAAPLERLRLYMRHWETCIRKKTEPMCIAALLGAELPSLPMDVAKETGLHFVALHGWLQKTIELGIKQKSIHLTQTASTEADVFMATVHGAMVSARAYPSAKVFGQIVEATLERLSQGA